MGCARSRSRDAYPKLAGELGIGRGHEGGHLFVSGLDEFDGAIRALQGAEYAVDAVARIAKDLSDTPGVKSLNDKVADGLGHVSLTTACRSIPGHSLALAALVERRPQRDVPPCGNPENTGDYAVCERRCVGNTNVPLSLEPQLGASIEGVRG
jgi:hypothetical protein